MWSHSTRLDLALALLGSGTVAVALASSHAYLQTMSPSTIVRHIWRRLQRMGWINDPADQEPEPELPGMPECRPIRSVAGLLTWIPPRAITEHERHQAFCMPPSGTEIVTVQRSSSSIYSHGAAKPKLLVCHDMRGGYQEDRWVQGASDPDAFNMWRWECVDVFIYFSHHMVTLPPPAWVRVARANGVQVLGTFITEWEAGRRKCEELLASPAIAQEAAEQLARLAQHFGFDGWLINIENPLPTSLIPNMMHFLGHLRARLKALCGHQAILMWYDAVTMRGKLEWQNTLNHLNQPFFDVCDAIYLNYGWKVDTPLQVLHTAGGRATDVYMGVDVWGRGSYGGGQNECHVALRAAHEAGLSAALFAPGWLYEAFPLDGLVARTNAWWDSVVAAWPPRTNATSSNIPNFSTTTTGSQSWLWSSFCQGAGRRAAWVQGTRVSTQPWHNLALQQRQPFPLLRRLIAFSAQAESNAAFENMPLTTQPVKGVVADAVEWKAQLYDSAAFTGGSCILLSGPVAVLAASPVLCQLFNTCVVMPATGLAVAFAWADDTSSAIYGSLDGSPTSSQRGHPPVSGADTSALCTQQIAVALWVKLPSSTSSVITESETGSRSSTTIIALIPSTTPIQPVSAAPAAPAPGLQLLIPGSAWSGSGVDTAVPPVAPRSAPYAHAPSPLPQDPWSPVSLSVSDVHTSATPKGAGEEMHNTSDWTWACASPVPITKQSATLPPPQTTSSDAQPQTGMGFGQQSASHPLAHAGVIVCPCPSMSLQTVQMSHVQQEHQHEQAPGARHTDVKNDKSEGVTDPVWRSGWLQVSSGVVPPGSLITGLGVVCWMGKSSSSIIVGQEEEKRLTDTGWLLGHLGVHDLAQADASCLPQYFGHASTAVQGPGHIPTSPPPSSTLSITRACNLSVYPYTPTAADSDSNLSPTVHGRAPTALLQCTALTSHDQVLRETADVQGTYHGSHATDVCCDLKWGGPTNLTGRLLHDSWHVWARDDTTSSTLDMRDAVAPHLGPSMPVVLLSEVAVPRWWESEKSENGARGATPVELPGNGSWKWLGQAVTGAFHARVKVGKAGIKATGCRVQFALQPVSSWSGLLATPVLNKCDLITLALDV